MLRAVKYHVRLTPRDRLHDTIVHMAGGLDAVSQHLFGPHVASPFV